jgi:ABC-2 type transport system ATP-binding protein
MELIIEGLSKRYDHNWALKEVSLHFETGMVGLVGPNGAGKTTLMRIISTLLPPTAGSVTWDGLDTRTHGQQIRQTLGYLPQDFGVYPEFSARRFLRYLAAMKGLPKNLAWHRVDEVLELVNLQTEADRKLGGFSGGMKQRVGIAQALLNDPELLIVDEPTAGLDPQERVRFRTLLAGLTSNRLIILSTHIISDVEAVASRLVILRQGKMLTDTTPERLLEAAHGQVWSVLTGHDSAVRLQAEYQVSALIAQREGVLLHIVSPVQPHPNASPVEPSLEDAYLVAGREGSPVLT